MTTNKKLPKWIFLILITNLLTLLIVEHYVKQSESKETSMIYQGMLSRYIIQIENNESKLAQTLMSGFIFPSIIDLGKSEEIDNGYKYLCESWSNGLDDVIRKEIFQTTESKMYQDYLLGAERLDNFCISASTSPDV